MNKHTHHYLRSHDIDLIFRAGNKAIHCATNGGMIPRKLNIIKSINQAKRTVRNLPYIVPLDSLIINQEHIESVVENQRRILERMAEENESRLEQFDSDLCARFYLSSFIEMARRGLHSYDRLQLPEEENEKSEEEYSDYTLVVSPGEGYDDVFFDTHLFDTPGPPIIDITDSMRMIESSTLRLIIT